MRNNPILLVRLIAFLIVFGVVVQLPANAAESGTIIIKAGRLIDGRGGDPISPVMVRIEGEKIAEVSRNLNVPTNGKIVDLGEATLLPGLIDLHTHLTGKMR